MLAKVHSVTLPPTNIRIQTFNMMLCHVYSPEKLCRPSPPSCHLLADLLVSHHETTQMTPSCLKLTDKLGRWGQQCAVVYSAISNEEEEERFPGQGKASLSKRIMVIFYFLTCVKLTYNRKSDKGSFSVFCLPTSKRKKEIGSFPVFCSPTSKGKTNGRKVQGPSGRSCDNRPVSSCD